MFSKRHVRKYFVLQKAAWNETKIEAVSCVEEAGFEVMENSMF